MAATIAALTALMMSVSDRKREPRLSAWHASAASERLWYWKWQGWDDRPLYGDQLR